MLAVRVIVLPWKSPATVYVRVQTPFVSPTLTQPIRYIPVFAPGYTLGMARCGTAPVQVTTVFLPGYPTCVQVIRFPENAFEPSGRVN